MLVNEIETLKNYALIKNVYSSSQRASNNHVFEKLVPCASRFDF